MTLADPAVARIENRLFIGGAFVDAVDGRTFDTLNPHDGSVITRVAQAAPADVDRAVVAASSAFPAWARMGAAAQPHPRRRPYRGHVPLLRRHGRQAPG